MKHIKSYKIFESTNLLDKAIEDILLFLYANDVINWNGFLNMSQFKRDSVNKIIDSYVNDKNDLDYIRYKIKLELCDEIDELKYMLSEYEEKEEYLKCKEINDQIKLLEG